MPSLGYRSGLGSLRHENLHRRKEPGERRGKSTGNTQPQQGKALEHLNRYGPSLVLLSGLLVDLGCRPGSMQVAKRELLNRLHTVSLWGRGVLGGYVLYYMHLCGLYNTTTHDFISCSCVAYLLWHRPAQVL